MEVVALINQLEALEEAAEKSVAAELETMLEGDQCGLRDAVGRERILEMCKEIRRGCQRLDTPAMLAKLQQGFAEAAAGAGGPTHGSAETRPGDGPPRQRLVLRREENVQTPSAFQIQTYLWAKTCGGE